MLLFYITLKFTFKCKILEQGFEKIVDHIQIGILEIVPIKTLKFGNYSGNRSLEMDCSKNGGIDVPWEENEARDLLHTGGKKNSMEFQA